MLAPWPQISATGKRLEGELALTVEKLHSRCAVLTLAALTVLEFFVLLCCSTRRLPFIDRDCNIYQTTVWNQKHRSAPETRPASFVQAVLVEGVGKGYSVSEIRYVDAYWTQVRFFIAREALMHAPATSVPSVLVRRRETIASAANVDLRKGNAALPRT